MADEYILHTELGDISFQESVFESIVFEAAKPYLDEEKLYFDRRRGWGKSLRGNRNDEMAGVDIWTDEEGTHFEVPVVLRFGVSIKGVTGDLIEGIRKGFRKLTGEEPASILVQVTGTLSKQLIRRDIEVEWHRES